MKIGILGGSFDPAHKGHLAISKEAKRRFKLKKIIWAVTKKNPLKYNKFGSDKEFVTKLLESKGVLTVHGSGFGEQYGSGHFRLVYLPSLEILNSAMDKIEEFVSQ